MTQLKNIEDADTWLYEEFLQDEIEIIGIFIIDHLGEIFEARKDWVKKPHSSVYSTMRKMSYFLEKIEDGDKLLNFDGFPFMGFLSGRAGYVIMRDGKVVDVYITRMS